jgi:hypothetical protein
MVQTFGIICMVMLATQLGLQPMANKAFVHYSVNSSIYIICMEIVKFLMCAMTLVVQGSLKECWQSWSLYESFYLAVVPALLYAIQNILVQQVFDRFIFHFLKCQKNCLFDSCLHSIKLFCIYACACVCVLCVCVCCRRSTIRVQSHTI